MKSRRCWKSFWPAATSALSFCRFTKKDPKTQKTAAVNGTEATEGAPRRFKRIKKVRVLQQKKQDGGNGEQRRVFRPKRRQNPQSTELQHSRDQLPSRMRNRRPHPKFILPRQQQQPPRQPQSQRQQLQNRQQTEQQRNPQSTVRNQRKGQRKGFRQPQSQQETGKGFREPLVKSWAPPPVGGSAKRARGKGQPRYAPFQMKPGGRRAGTQQVSVMKPSSKKFKTFGSRGDKGGKSLPAF